jgi:hypothetical protein
MLHGSIASPYLRPDVICIVVDPIGHVLVQSAFLPARHSRAFAMFGYSPILPLVLQEKGTLVHSPLLRLAGDTLAAADAVLGGTREQGCGRDRARHGLHIIH